MTIGESITKTVQKTESKQEGKALFLTVDETHDPKNQSKIAHRSCSPKYDNTGTLIGYNFGNPTESTMRKEELAKKNKK
jgi:hypothetical protein